MEYYVKRLIKCGYSPRDALTVYRAFVADHGIFKFVSFLKSLENKKCG